MKDFKKGFTRTLKLNVTPKGGGFTLIELLVVVAIIGVLASVVLASLNSARNKGTDASVRANLANVRAQAEMFYDSTGAGAYTGACAVGATTINAGVLAAVRATNSSGTVVINGLQTATNGACNAAASTWTAQAPLRAGGNWCVDSSGNARAVAGMLPAGATVCPAS